MCVCVSVKQVFLRVQALYIKAHVQEKTVFGVCCLVYLSDKPEICKRDVLALEQLLKFN